MTTGDFKLRNADLVPSLCCSWKEPFTLETFAENFTGENFHGEGPSFSGTAQVEEDSWFKGWEIELKNVYAGSASPKTWVSSISKPCLHVAIFFQKAITAYEALSLEFFLTDYDKSVCQITPSVADLFYIPHLDMESHSISSNISL